MILIRTFLLSCVTLTCKGGRVKVKVSSPSHTSYTNSGYSRYGVGYSGYSQDSVGASGYSPIHKIYNGRKQQSSVNLKIPTDINNRKSKKNPSRRTYLKSKIADYGKPPLIVYNKPRKFNNFEKLQLVQKMDNIERYSNSEYREQLSNNEVIAKDDGSLTTIRMVKVTKLNEKGTTAEYEVNWQITKTYTTGEENTYYRRPNLYTNKTSTHHHLVTSNDTSSSLNVSNPNKNSTHGQHANSNTTKSKINESKPNIYLDKDKDTTDYSKRKIKAQQIVIFKMNSRSLKTCMQELGISTSYEPILAYTCYYWSGGPQIFFLSFVFLLCLFYILMPVMITMLYVSSVSGTQNYCYMVPNHGEHQTVRESKPMSTKTITLCFLFGAICLCIPAGLIYFFHETIHALNMNNSNKVLTTNLAIRISISLASLLATLYLSHLASGIGIKKFFPLTRRVGSCLNYDPYDENDWCTGILLLITGILEMAFTCSIIIFKVFHISLLGVAFLLAEKLQNLYIWAKRIKFDKKELLYYGYLSDQEKSQWISAVEAYVSIIQTSIKSKSLLEFYSYFNLYNRRIKERTSKVSFLHTGSIPEQFGKPLMVFDGLNRSISNSFPELRSDHDVMFVLEHIPVYEEGNENHQEDFWLKAEVMQEDGNEEFVKIVPMLSNTNILIPYLSNRIASNFLTQIVSDSFFKNGKTTDELKELPMMINTREMGQSMSSSNQVFISRAGPSVNMKVTGIGGHHVFDCDFLLSLPVIGWPSPAKEWRIRGRKWPEKEMVEWLVQLPCHLIAKPINEQDQKTWRFSFSRQELELSKILPLNARLCYIALKHIFKKHLKSINCGLKSYHMLTLFFWFMEMEDPGIWQQVDKDPLSFNTAILSLLRFVADSLQAEYIPHYFIRTINLVKIMRADTRMTARLLRDVAAKIQEMYSGNDLSDEYIFDQTAHDTIVLNRELHKNVLRERNPPTSFTQAEIPYFGPQIPDPDYD